MNRFVVAFALCSFAGAPFAQDAKDKDYSTDLPRIPPRSPAASQKCFQLRPGFRIELVTAEPHVQSPVAIDFDEDGRMYVCEFPEYNQYANPKYKGKGRVKLLDDIDGDGRYEKSSIFVDNLDAPVAVCCWDGGVFVGAVPNLWYFKDTDGDGKADVRRVVLTGFARDAAGEGMLNSFQWRFDNRIHISTNIAGGMVRRMFSPGSTNRGGQETDGDSNLDKGRRPPRFSETGLNGIKPVNVKSRNIVFDPRTGDFELTSGGGQHGMTIDDWGRTFVCSNSDPMSVIMYDDRYLARNPYVAAPSPVVRLMPEAGKTKIFRVSPVEPWRALRTKLRTEKIVPGSDEGGNPAGFFTGATGVTAYRGHAWPEEFKNQLFVGEVSGNLVFRAKVVPQGVGFVGRRMDEGCEFLASTDNWFRPVQFANGPDGNLYVIDMYRELIEGAAFLPPVILKHMDVSSGIDRGRIWRIVREGWKFDKQPKLSKATTAELVALLEHPNGWHRDTASRLLYRRQDTAAISMLERLAKESKSALGRLHAMYALEGIGSLKREVVIAGLRDDHPRVRELALRLAEKCELAIDKLLALASDDDARVRYQLALTLGAVETFQAMDRFHAFKSQVRYLVKEGVDPWIRSAILVSAHRYPGAMFSEVLLQEEFRAKLYRHEMLTTLAEQIGASNIDLNWFWDGIQSSVESEPALSEKLVRSMVSKQSVSARKAPLTGKAAVMVRHLVKSAEVAAVDDKLSPEKRVESVRTLGLADFRDQKQRFTELLQLRQPPQVQAAVIRTLDGYDEPEVADVVLKAWPSFSPKLRATAVQTLSSRSEWMLSMLNAVEKKQVARSDLDPVFIDQLQRHIDMRVRTRAAQVFGKSTLGKRDDVVKAYQKSLDLKGDRARGKELFKKECAACHRLEGVGTQLGGDLNAIRNRGRESILLNILDPNREVLPQYVSYTVVLDDGRTLTGMLSAETATSITLNKPDGTGQTILRVNIESLRSTGLSFMPEGLEQRVDRQGMADLLAYLESIR